MRIPAGSVFQHPVRVASGPLRFRGNEDKPDEFIPAADIEPEEPEQKDDSPLYNALLRFSTALIIVATGLLIHGRYQNHKNDEFVIPPKIHAPAEPVQPIPIQPETP